MTTKSAPSADKVYAIGVNGGKNGARAEGYST